MKKFFFILSAATLFCQLSYGQLDSLYKPQTNREVIEQRMLKSKQHTKTACILVGTGVALTAVGLLTFPKDYNIIGENSSGVKTNATLSSIAFVAGAALIITSIPVFISGIVNKHKARLLMKTEKLAISPQLNMPGLQFKTGIAFTF